MGGEQQPEQPASAEARDRTARGRILAAAERLFAERGYDRTSTALIAAEARVPQGLIFYHFKTKMELLLAVIRGDQAGLLDGLLPAPAPEAGLRQAVTALWRHLSAVLGEPSPARKIIIQEVAAHPEIRQRALELHEQMTMIDRPLSRAGQPAPGRSPAGARSRRPPAHHRRRDGPPARRARPHADPGRRPRRPDQRRPPAAAAGGRP